MVWCSRDQAASVSGYLEFSLQNCSVHPPGHFQIPSCSCLLLDHRTCSFELALLALRPFSHDLYFPMQAVFHVCLLFTRGTSPAGSFSFLQCLLFIAPTKPTRRIHLQRITSLPGSLFILFGLHLPQARLPLVWSISWWETWTRCLRTSRRMTPTTLTQQHPKDRNRRIGIDGSSRSRL